MQDGSKPKGHQPVLLMLTTTERPSASFPSTYTQPSRMKGVSTNSERCKLSVQETTGDSAETWVSTITPLLMAVS
jgi:hypothetical protein